MNSPSPDILWPHFAPLWTEIRKMTPGVLLAGGYGLFLKQGWLLSRVSHLVIETGEFLVTEKGERLIADPGIRTVVQINEWNDQTPRVTKDLDFIAELNLIASPEDQRRLADILKKQEFNVVGKNARWQFAKQLDASRSVVLDFHAPSPVGRDDLRVQSRRVKPNPSLKGVGIHGRENPEAVGCDLHPFSFVFEGVEVVIPNPVTLAIMKLAAMKDRWLASQDLAQSAGERQFESDQAKKHAEDVFRVVAMMTQEEAKQAEAVIAALRETSAFTEACQTFTEYFGNAEGWTVQLLSSRWREEHFHVIQSTLVGWFRRALPGT